MFIEIKRHDGPSRLGKLHYGDHKIKTPNFFSVLTKNWSLEHDIYLTSHENIAGKDPMVIDYGGLYIEKEIDRFGILPRVDVGFDVPREIAEDAVSRTLEFAEKYPGYGVVVVGSKYRDMREECVKRLRDRPLLEIANGGRLVKNPRLLVDIVTKIREIASPNTAIYFRGAPPPMFCLLSYMGIDLFDSIDCIAEARERKMITSRGYLDLDKIDELPCSCETCKGKGPSDLKDDVEGLIKHNFDTTSKIMKEIRVAIKLGELRNLVEEKASCSVNAMVALRLLDTEKGDFLEKYTKIC